MHFSGQNGYNKTSDDQHHDHFTVTDTAVEHWPKPLTTAIPTIFPLRSSSHSIVDASITRLIDVSNHNVIIDHGIKLSTILTLAYGLVLRAHADSPDEVVFGCVHDEKGINGSDIIHTVMPSFVQHIIFDWEETTLSSLVKLQDDSITQSGSLRPSNNGQMINPGETAPLFRTILSLNSVSGGSYKSTFKMDQAGHDFLFNIKVIGCEEIEIEVQYASAAISEAEVEAFLDHFGVAIKNIPQNLTKPLSEISLISLQEQQRLIMDINPAYSPNMSLSPANNVTELFEEQVCKTPQKIALQLDQDQFITYKHLDSLANHVAHILNSKDVRRGDLVGIYMDKCSEMFIGILGIHKAGGGYVPLDPEHPVERIQTILGVAGIKIVLTQKEFQSRFEPHNWDNNVIFLTVDNCDLSAAIQPYQCSDRDDICYVIFTSGSTGTPKGVVVTHGSAVESVVASRDLIGPLDGRVLQFSNYTFDFSVWDWCSTLSGGGTLCVVPKQRLLDDLGGVAKSLDITYLGTTPTVAGLISPQEIPSLQTLSIGGEMLTREVRDKWAEAVRFLHMYGPTETTVCVTAHKSFTPSTELSNIGRPFGLNVIYVLDERLRPVPLGCVGELYIGGPQVARGYLNDPKQTEKVFVKDPFRPGSLMYASGDLVRMRPVDYSIHYLGRRDTQIKIHGLRVENGEIEAALKAASSMITNALVIKADVGRDILVAFLEIPSEVETDDLFILHDDQDRIGTLLESLRRAIRHKLPAYMTPNIYVPLNHFPLSSSGKLDRKSLTSFFYAHQDEIRDLRLDPEFPSQLPSPEMPLDDLQVTLRSLCALILNIKEDLLSIDADFFTVGGDSISAIRLANAARTAGIHLSTTDIIHNPTIRKLATIAQTAIVLNQFDEDEIPSVPLDQMGPEDLTLLDLDQNGLDVLRNMLLSTYSISSSDVLDIYPCTALQTSFLAAGLLIDDAYIVRQIYDLPPGSNSIKIREAFDNLVNHANGTMFRTIFIFDSVTSGYLQVVTRPSWKRMEWTTVQVTTEAELEMAIDRYRRGRGCHKFEQGELLTRACVFELNGIPRALVWAVHHVLADHWTLNNAECDIADLYFQRPLPYRRSLKPMIKYLESVDRTASLDFWKTHLLDAEPTHFPQSLWNAPRSVVDSFIYREVRIDHSSFTRRFGVMAASLATLAWSVVIATHTSSTDVVFGQVVAGRNAPIKDIDSMAGNTINTIPRRVILKPDTSILETLLDIQKDQIEISKHEHIGLAELKSYGVAAANLFKTILNFTNLPGDQKPSSDVSDTSEYLLMRRSGSYDGQDIPFALTVTPVTTKDFYLEVSYKDGLISEEEICVIMDHYETALRFMIDHPEKPVSDVELINDREIELLIPTELSTIQVRRPNGHGQPYHPYDGIPEPARNVSELIEWQVEKTPEKIALQFDHNVFLTYRQMEALSNYLARRLILRGVEKGNLVALCMDKSIEMFLSILAVHKAGGAYVPLDPQYPAERVNTILRLSQSAVVLTTKGLRSQLASMVTEVDVSLIVVDLEELDVAPKPDICVNRDDICYVLFTSGSTGAPKGVVVTHGSVIESVLASRDLVDLLGHRVLQFSNYTFDFSVWDWCCALSSGATLCIVQEQKLLDDLSGVVKNLDITYLGTTPTVAMLMSPQEVPPLQMLLLGGEMVTIEVRDTWADVVSLMNLYGLTETSICITAHKSFTSSIEVSNIGRPIGRNAVYVLDERLRPVPLGCVGQLFLGGPQVARGYLGDPEQTAKVFVKDPFRPGSMMYASGDLVRMSPVDYSISYLGRRDTQIKIHGLRVEIGEIETVLKTASSVITNAVVIKADVGRETLVAFLEIPSSKEPEGLFIIRDDQDRISALLASLRRTARQKLPTYMSPHIYVPLNRFPLSSSGKLDRKSLAAFFQAHQDEISALRLDSEPLQELSSSEIPHDELQATLRSLWASTLKTSQELLSIDDDFFIVGGDSISAIRLAGAARAAGLSLPVTDIIRNPTIRKMAQIVQSAVPRNDYDEDETPPSTLDKMHPNDLTLLKLDSAELDSMRSEILSKHGFAASDILDVYPTTALQTSFLLAGLIVPNAYIMAVAWDLSSGTDTLKLQEAFSHFIDHPNGMMLRTTFLFEPVSNKWLQVLIRPGQKRMEWKIINVGDEAELV